MPELCIILADRLPPSFSGSFGSYSVNELGSARAIAIEDYYYKGGTRLGFSAAASVITLQADGVTINENRHATLTGEFALALLALEGHPKIAYAALFNHSICIECQELPTNLATFTTPRFATRVKSNGVAQWLYRCFTARKRNVEHIDVMAHRYVRYSRFTDEADALLDLSIALESLLNAQSEVSFRFSLTLTKLRGLKGVQAVECAEMLTRLYVLRCKLAHGAPDISKALSKVQPQLPSLRKATRQIVVNYVLFLGDKTRKEWDGHINSMIYD